MNLFDSLPDATKCEITERLIEAERVRVERIVSQGQASPPGFWYDQTENEFVIVLRGAAKLALEDQILEMKAGDWCHLAAHQKHRIAWTDPLEPTVWLAVFYD